MIDLEKQTPAAPGRLTPELAEQMRRAVVRLARLESANIVTADTDVEKGVLKKFLAEMLWTYQDELVATWHVMHSEYVPLVKAWTNFNRRCASVVAPAPAGTAPIQPADPATSSTPATQEEDK